MLVFIRESLYTTSVMSIVSHVTKHNINLLINYLQVDLSLFLNLEALCLPPKLSIAYVQRMEGQINGNKIWWGVFKTWIKFLSLHDLKLQTAECRTGTFKDLSLSSGLTCLMGPSFIRQERDRCFCHCMQKEKLLLLWVNQESAFSVFQTKLVLISVSFWRMGRKVVPSSSAYYPS